MLTSLQNPLVKQIRKLHGAKQRHRQNLLLLEGTNLLEGAAQSNYPLVSLVATSQWQSQHPSLWEKLTLQAQRTEIVSDEVLKAIATTVNPDGVVATAMRNRGQSSMPEPESVKLGLVLERIQDPGNLGTIIRTSVATEVDALWVSADSVDLDHPKVMRASAGEWFRLQMDTSDNLREQVLAHRQKGTQIIATLPQAAKNYWQIDFSRPSLILLGNEASGLSDGLTCLADEGVRIPLGRGVESLNVAIAAALLLYEHRRQVIPIQNSKSRDSNC